MNIPDFKRARIVQLLHGLVNALGGDESARQLEAELRAISDPAAYLRRVADLGEFPATNLITSAVLGLVVATMAHQLAAAGDTPEARLHAAASELLAACKAMLGADLYADAEGVWEFAGSDTAEGREAVKLARAAVAKAEGGAK